MGLLDRLDDLDYRLRLRQRPGTTQARPLTSGRVRFLRVVCCIWLGFLVLAVLVAIVKGVWVLPVIALIPWAQWFLYEPETRRQVWPRRQKR